MFTFLIPEHLRLQTHIILKPDYYPVASDGTIQVHPHHVDLLRQHGYSEVAPPPPVLPLPEEYFPLEAAPLSE